MPILEGTGDPEEVGYTPPTVAPEPTPAPSGGGTGSTGGGTSTAPSAPQQPTSAPVDPSLPPEPELDEEELEAYIRTTYGYLAWALDHPELGKILREAARRGLAPLEVQASVMGTKWWKQTSSSAREWQKLKAEDPATAESQIKQQYSIIFSYSRRLGYNFTSARMRRMAEDAIKFGWNEQQLRSAIISEITYRPNQLARGTIGSTMDQLQQIAMEYYIPFSQKQLYEWSKNIEKGSDTAEGFKSYVQHLAEGQFPHLAKYMKSGISPAQYFEPFRQTVATILEKNVQNVDLFQNPQYRKITDFVDDKGNRRAMTLSETMDYLRTLPEWLETDNAKRAAADLSVQLLETFGAF